MITRDATNNLLLSMSRFIAKRGADMASRQDLADAINVVLGEDLLDAIYINSVDNVLLPDIAVIHLYNNDFSRFLLDPDNTDTCPFGFTLEIHDRCLTGQYTEEELSALILHDILQNVLSDTAKIRFIRAYTSVISKHKITDVLDMFDSVSLSEVTFMMFTEICMRPFRAPIMDFDYVATDEVLKTIGLGDAYDSYLKKTLPMTPYSVESQMGRCLKDDYRDVNTIIDACLDGTIRHYYHVIRESVPMVTLNHIFDSKSALASTGFISRKRVFKRKPGSTSTVDAAKQEKNVLAESYNDPKNDLEIRFAIDKIINALRYAETEAEREVVLFRIKQLSLKLVKMQLALEKKRNLDVKTSEKIRTLKAFLDELESIRAKAMSMEIKTKRWHVYIKDSMPAGYDF